ncbi:MAG TPA: hypothetical protein VGZ47_10485 [Gemmataceae bacterium]|jgi:hypothetical protein|nr:hypothetical protein [Gemmataceae bacterium]
MAGKVQGPRRFKLALLFLAAGIGCNFLAGVGCNLLALPFMLIGPGPEGERTPPEYAFYTKATQEKHKRDITLVVLPYHSRSVPIEFNGADLKLANFFVKHLTQKFADNGESVKIIPIYEVEKFKHDHPEWKTMGPKAIGEFFKADYVLDMELAALTLMDKQSRQPFLLGNVRVELQLLDVDSKEGEQPLTKEFTRKFPQLGARPVDLDTSKDSFQQEFFQHVAVEMSWWLTGHTFQENKSTDD